MIQLDQLPQLSNPMVSNDDDFVALNWGPRYEEGRVYGDLRRSPLLDHGHDHLIQFW